MNIEINGAGFINKGAELMLRTTISRLTAKDPSISCAVAAGRDKPPIKVARAGASYIWPSSSLFGLAGRYKPQLALNNLVSRFVHSKRLAPYGLITRYEIDALLDISGYAFGDHWGLAPMKKFIALSDFYRQRNKPVIMLPQMLGPFDNPEAISSFRKLANNCTLIYARDDVSLEASRKAAPNANIQLCPDITICSTGPEYCPDQLPTSKRVCIVPNIRMTDSGTSPWPKEEYTTFLAEVATSVSNANHIPVLVLHDVLGRDGELANVVAEQFGAPIEIFSEPDPKKLKSYIAESKFLIGSRFHSLVAALSSNVPVIAIGWAHKYIQLLTDYGQERFNVVDKSRTNDCFEMIGELANTELFHSRKKVIIEKNAVHRSRIDEMWREVHRILGSGG